MPAPAAIGLTRPNLFDGAAFLLLSGKKETHTEIKIDVHEKTDSQDNGVTVGRL